ncbi:hypothetical protein [Micromonospora chalcea]|uniref:hypothetical protein n=1 Tax=Micromonospora chalcea TaxID=1874 RepID=UPI003D9DBD30
MSTSPDLTARPRGPAATPRGWPPNAEDFAWVQEEPANQGAWSFVALNLLEHLPEVRPAGRCGAAGPRAGAPAG